MRAGVPVTDSRVQEVVARHHRWVCLSWTPDAEAYVGLGELYVDDERFTAFYDGSALGSASGNTPSGTPPRKGLAAYLRDAMAVHARQTLALA